MFPVLTCVLPQALRWGSVDSRLCRDKPWGPRVMRAAVLATEIAGAQRKLGQLRGPRSAPSVSLRRGPRRAERPAFPSRAPSVQGPPVDTHPCARAAFPPPGSSRVSSRGRRLPQARPRLRGVRGSSSLVASRASAASHSLCTPLSSSLSCNSIWNVSRSLPWPAGPGTRTLRAATLTGQGWGDRKEVSRVQNLRMCSLP